MTNLDYVINGVQEDTAAAQFNELIDALQRLNYEFSGDIDAYNRGDDYAEIDLETIKGILKPWRQLTA